MRKLFYFGWGTGALLSFIMVSLFMMCQKPATQPIAREHTITTTIYFGHQQTTPDKLDSWALDSNLRLAALWVDSVADLATTDSLHYQMTMIASASLQWASNGTQSIWAVDSQNLAVCSRRAEWFRGFADTTLLWWGLTLRVPDSLSMDWVTLKESPNPDDRNLIAGSSYGDWLLEFRDQCGRYPIEMQNWFRYVELKIHVTWTEDTTKKVSNEKVSSLDESSTSNDLPDTDWMLWLLVVLMALSLALLLYSLGIKDFVKLWIIAAFASLVALLVFLMLIYVLENSPWHDILWCAFLILCALVAIRILMLLGPALLVLGRWIWKQLDNLITAAGKFIGWVLLGLGQWWTMMKVRQVYTPEFRLNNFHWIGIWIAAALILFSVLKTVISLF